MTVGFVGLTDSKGFVGDEEREGRVVDVQVVAHGSTQAWCHGDLRWRIAGDRRVGGVRPGVERGYAGQPAKADMFFPPAVSLVALSFARYVSIFEPWGWTRCTA